MVFPFSRRLVASFAAVLAVMFAGLGSIASHSPARALTNCDVADLSMDSQETAFLGLINQYRAQNGLGSLTVSTNLNRAASWKAVDLATNNYFSHTDSLGRAPAQLSVDCGYPLGAGENLAAGTVWDTAQEAFDAWKASAGHNANMLTSYYQQIGIARYYGSSSTYGWYWVTEFGTTNDGTSGSGSATATPTATTVANAKAAITSPADGSTLAGSTATFSWSAGSGALEYFLYAGSSQGANNYYGASQGTSLSRSLSGLPTNGSSVYIRLWTRFSTGWQYTDYSYTAATASSGGGVSLGSKASLISPAPGAYLPVWNASFSWAPASGGLEYFFYLGTSQGANNLYGQSQGLNTSLTFGQLPSSSGPVFVRLWTRTASGWTYTDYSFAGIR